MVGSADSQEDLLPDERIRGMSLQAVVRTPPISIERLYADHHRDVFRYVLGLTRSFDEAEEIAADTFERAIRSWDREPDRPIAWLLLTARRIATDRWRRARRLAAVLTGLRAGAPRSIADVDAGFGAWFDSLSTVLTPRQREVLMLRYQRDLTDADIAVVMGLTESGVRSLAARALAALRAHPELL